MDEKYWALVDLRYPAGEAEYKKAVAGEKYEQVVVEAGGPLVNVSESSVKAYLAHGRPVIENERERKKRLAKVKKAEEVTP